MSTSASNELSRFTALVVENVGPNRWRLRYTFHYFRARETITVPAGFTTDFASIPRFMPVSYSMLKGRAEKAAVIHDFLYRTQKGRKYADDVFYEAMKDSGVPWAARQAMYWGVRLGGWAGYQANA